MPSYLTDQNSPIFSQHSDIVNLDPNNQLGLKQPVHEGSINHVRPRPVNESFDDSSITSAHDSDVSDTTPMPMNANGTRPTSMSSYTNGYVNGNHENGNADWPNEKPYMNGNAHTATLPDRSLSNRPPANSLAQGYDASTGRQSPADLYQKHPKKSSDLSAPLPPIPSDAETPNMASLSLTPASPTPDVKSSPQRLSTSAIYPSGNSTHSTSTFTQTAANGSTLKQRQNLDVPKSGPRASKDGMDTAQASGRFSPTSAPVGRRASLSLGRRPTRSMQSDYPRDEIVPDEDALRWAEAYRQKRASKRRRKEEEDDERVVVGTKVDETHANWVTAYNMLTGIRVSVSRTNAKLDRELTDADFEAKQKSTFDIAGNELVPSAKYDFKFKDYAPWVFRRLRHLFRLDPADYLMSLTGKYILSELGSPGKSGSFFYFSRDYKYIIKTIHHGEHKFLRKILRDYYSHVQENPNTLLSQFYGLHRVKMPYGKKIHFVVMNNLFPPHRDIHTTFDLKGSTHGRDYKEEDLESNPRATLKDLNWLRRKRQLELGMEKKRLFLEQLQRDVVLLKRLQIMDYSLLIGVHDLSRGNDENLRDKTLQVFNPGGEKAPDDEPQAMLLRTPSKLENARKARELRQMIRQERPVPMGQATDRMPDELGEGHSRPGFVFNQDDGGFRATHEDNNPADEIYYLGVIDCLTHYGMIKKIEHFWKGLSSDRTQISALPPDQYGDRFYNFVEGITMSQEAAQREIELGDQQALDERAGDRMAHRGSGKRNSQHVPPMPNHQPPPPPARSPEARATVDKASKEAWRELDGPAERQIPDRTLRAATVATDARDSQHEPVLPVVQEVGESSDVRTGAPNRNKMLPPTQAPPPIPPSHAPPPVPFKSAFNMKPESADSGYGGNSGQDGSVSRDNSLKLRHRISRESLNKSLPPLPKKEETEDSGVKMYA
jgi:1-phosphatidylinositol-4-phosphate 5-kinase